jgi:hypothetical protein
MKMLRFILPLLLAFPALAIDRITLTITVTNVPVTSNTLVINSSSRYWTNAQSSTTFSTNLVGLGPATTNLFNQIAANPYSGPLILRYVDTNQIRLIGTLGGALSASQAGDWASLVLSTQSGPSTFTALYPLENIVGETNRTNQASAFVDGLNAYATNRFNTNATALGNYLSKGASPLQTVTGPVQFYNVSGTNSGLTNGAIKGATLYDNVAVRLSGELSNIVAQAFQSTNVTVWGSLYFGDTSSGVANAWIMRQVNASHLEIYNDDALSSPLVITNNSGIYRIDIGTGAVGEVIRIFSTLVAGNVYAQTISSHNAYLTNAAIRDATVTGTNILNGRIDLTAGTHTSLANGYNSGVVVGTNAYRQFSGPSGAYTNAGFAAPGGPQFAVLQFDNPGLSFTLLNESGLDATAANRILTGTGALLNSTNNPALAQLIYDTAASRWRVISFR